MNDDPSIRKADDTDTEGHVRRWDVQDTEGHVRFLLDEQGNPDVVTPDDSEDTEGHKMRKLRR